MLQRHAEIIPNTLWEEGTSNPEATRSVVSPLTVRLIQHQWISELVTVGLGLERLHSHKGSTEYTEGAPCALKTHTCNGSLLQSQ